MSAVQTDGIAISDDSGSASGTVLATYDNYEEAQRAVDRLSDASFPVENVEIVGRGLRFVERVTGRMTVGRASAAGAASGAWFGLFIGLLIGLFTTGNAWLWLMLAGLLIGAAWGAVFGFVAQWATHGRRDFSSLRSLSAQHYDLLVPEETADEARGLLSVAS